MPRQGQSSPESSTPDARPAPPSPPPAPAPSSPRLLLASPWGPLGRSLTLTAVAAACKAVLLAGNTFEVRDGGGAAADGRAGGAPGGPAAARERLAALAAARAPGRGLLSVSNHTSTLDDPALFAALLPLSLFATDPLGGQQRVEVGGEGGGGGAGRGGGGGGGDGGAGDFAVGGGRAVRWSLCARDVCFSRGKLLSDFFLAGKTLPVERDSNRGVAQPATEAAAEVLRGGGWVHVFPEGRVELSGRLPPPLPPPAAATTRKGGREDSAPSSPPRLPSRMLSRARGLWASGLFSSSSSSPPPPPPSSSEEEEKNTGKGAEEEGGSTRAPPPPPPPPRRPRAFRRGVGALYCDCLNRGGQPPVLLPFYHSGMADVMPRGARVPRFFFNDAKVVVVVGLEVDVSDLNPGCSSPDERVREATWAAIAERLRRELARLEALAPRNRDQRSEREKAREKEEEELRSNGNSNGRSF